jgi:hypothetical protein
VAALVSGRVGGRPDQQASLRHRAAGAEVFALVITLNAPVTSSARPLAAVHPRPAAHPQGTPAPATLPADLLAAPQAPALSAELLAGIPSEIRSLVWRWLLRALDDALWDADGPLAFACPTQEDLPERVCPAPFDPDALRPLAREVLRRLLRVEVRLALAALEVAVLTRSPSAYAQASALVQAHGTHIGQLYRALCERIHDLAWLDLLWELRLLRHRGSGAVAPLIWGPEHAAHPQPLHNFPYRAVQ